MRQTPPEPVTTLLEDLPFCLVRASLSFRRFNDLSLRTVNLDTMAPGLASVLHAADELGPCSVNRLVERTHLPNSTLTGLLDGLEGDGCIQRTRNPEDGRSRLISLTPKGNLLCAKLRSRHRIVMHHIRKSLSDSEVSELACLLEKFTHCMQSFDPLLHEVTSPPSELANRQ